MKKIVNLGSYPFVVKLLCLWLGSCMSVTYWPDMMTTIAIAD